MRLTDEQLAAIAATEGWHWDQPRAMARELLTARRVVEAARKAVRGTPRGELWAALDDLLEALTALDAGEKK